MDSLIFCHSGLFASEEANGVELKRVMIFIISGVSYQLSFTWTCPTPRPVRVRTWKLIKASSWSFTAFFQWSLSSHLAVQFERWNWRMILPGLAKKIYRSLFIQMVDYINYSILNNINERVHTYVYLLCLLLLIPNYNFIIYHFLEVSWYLNHPVRSALV